MNRSTLKQINPVMARAEVRRSQWELEATRKAGFWRKPRYDNVDLILLMIGIPSLILTIIGLIS